MQKTKLLKQLRQTVDDSVLTHTGRGIGVMASQRVADEIMQLLDTHIEAILQRIETEVIGGNVEPNMHPGLLQSNQDAQNRLKNRQRESLTKLREVFNANGKKESES